MSPTERLLITNMGGAIKHSVVSVANHRCVLYREADEGNAAKYLWHSVSTQYPPRFYVKRYH